MAKCDFLFILVGDISVRNKWQMAEIKMGIRKNIPFLAVRILNTMDQLPARVPKVKKNNVEPGTNQKGNQESAENSLNFQIAQLELDAPFLEIISPITT